MPTESADRRRLEQLTEETRTIASEMHDPEAKRFMRQVVWGYEVLAKHARKRERQVDALKIEPKSD